jgi:chemotaxis protein methyltransferase CheR
MTMRAPSSPPSALTTAVVDTLYEAHGVDLRDYASPTLERRMQLATARLGRPEPHDLIARLRHDPALARELVDDLTVQVSELFRDPSFYLSFRQKVVPVLRTYPLLRIWNAGCAGGEEVYALAVLLAEEGLYDRAQIYGTDLSARAIARAKQGVFAARYVRRVTENYQRAGGTRSFSDYYQAGYDRLVMREDLRRNIVFFQHDLVGDYVFGAMHVLFCRNVLIYFNKSLQERVLRKLEAGLARSAFLCLGRSEMLPRGESQRFQPFDEPARIYRWLGQRGTS